MIEKHLTEAPWKALVSKTQVKDTFLQKALLAYSKLDGTKDAAQALGALDEIGALAVKLKKANSALKEVTAYLDEVIKEVHKTKSGLMAQENKTEAKEDAKAPPEDSDLKDRLISALKKIKSSEGQQSIRFLVCVAKPCYGVLLARSANEKLGPTHRKELARLTKGTKFIEGECVFEKEAHTFVVEAVPTGLAKNLKTALKEYTGLAYKVRVRDVEGKVVADGDTEVDPEEDAGVAAQIPVTPLGVRADPATTPGGAEMVKFTARLKALQADIVKAIATKTPQGDEVKHRAVEAGALASKKDFAKANQLLGVVESLLQKAAGTTPASIPTPASTSGVDGAFQKAWASANSKLLEALDTVREQLATFATALMASGEENLIWIAEEGLSQVLGSLRDSALTIDRATSRLPARVVFKARPAIENLKKQIATPRVLACDQNKLGVTVTIRDTISRAVQEVEAALELAKA